MSQIDETRLQMPEHSDGGEAFFTAVGCMDGRVHEPVAEFGRKKFGAEFADTITEPGIVGILAKEPPAHFLDELKAKLDISINKHCSKGIIVHGHEDCAALYAVPDKEQIEETKKSAEKISDLIGRKIPVVGAFVRRSPGNSKIWEVIELEE